MMMSVQLTILLSVAIMAVCYLAWLRSDTVNRRQERRKGRQEAQNTTLVAKTVIVHTRDDRSLKGCMIGDHADRLSLHAASYLSPGGGETSLQGTVHVPRANVAFLQEIQPVLTVDPADTASSNGHHDAVLVAEED
jgi:hypothetical protein